MDDVLRHGVTHEGLDATLGRWSSTRHGVFTRSVARRFGASHRAIRWRLNTGRWEELYPGVYRFVAAPASWRQQLLAACWSCGPGAVASHRAASGVVSLAGVLPGELEISVARGKRQHRSGVTIHEVRSLPKVDIAVVDGIPVTTVTRTLIDLGAVVTRDVLEEALDDALRRSLTSISRVRWRLSELARRGRPGIAAIRVLLDAREPAAVTPRSVLETRFLRFLRVAKLPPPVLQHEIRVRGRLVAVVDFAYPGIKLAIEVDGYRWHSGRARWEHDLARRNRLTALGWRVIHVTAADLAQGTDELVRTIAAALAQPHPR